MTDKEALDLIKKALEDILERPMEISSDTDLLKEEILDSLDGMKFAFALEEMSSVRLPDDDLAEKGYFRVENLIRLLTSGS